MGPSLALVVLLYSHAPSSGAADGSAAHVRLVEALRRAGAQVVTPAIGKAIAARAQGWRPTTDLSFFTRGRSALERGRRARERVELDEAARLLTEAEASYADGLALPGGASLAAEAALEHGVALAELGRGDDARAAFRRALALAPGLALTERVARPDVVKLFAEVARAPARARRALTLVAGTLPIADDVGVVFDGQQIERGVGRVETGAGWHLVVAERDGVRVARLLELGDKEATIDVPVPHDPVIARLRALRSMPSREGIDTLREALDVGGVLVATLAADERRMLVTRVGEGCATPVVELDVTSDEALASGLRKVDDNACMRGADYALRLDDPRLAPVVVVAPAPRKRNKTWPWIFLGAVGATAAIVGVTVGVVTSDPRYTLRVDGRSFGASP